jgi:hypothetical protein
LRRQQAQEETEARELSLLYGTSCETILALKRSIQVANDSQEEDDENDSNENDHDPSAKPSIDTSGMWTFHHDKSFSDSVN